jgi:hypothetical protein
MQNKPNFRKSQMNVNIYNTTDYENKSDWTIGQNKPNSNPNKPNFFKGQNEQKIACRKIRPHPTAKHGSFLLALNRNMVNNS